MVVTVHDVEDLRKGTGGQGKCSAAKMRLVPGNPAHFVRVVVKEYYDYANAKHHRESEIKTLHFLHDVPGVVPLLGQTATNGLVFPRAPMSIDNAFMQTSDVGCVQFFNERPNSSPQEARKFILKMAEDLYNTMHKLHVEKKLTHGDVSTSNILVTIKDSEFGGIVSSLDDLRFVFIDFGHSKSLPYKGNSGHTKPYGSRYFFSDKFSESMEAQAGDLFQVPRVCWCCVTYTQTQTHLTHTSQLLGVLLQLTVKLKPNAYKAMRSKETDCARVAFGEKWRQQNQGWVQYVVSHQRSECSSQALHENYCCPVRDVFSDHTKDVQKLDNWFSPPK